MSLQTFIEKAKAKEAKRVKVTKIDIEDFGEVEFSRPKEEVLLDFMSIAENRENIAIKDAVLESSKFIYLCCPNMQAKEVREQYSDIEPTQIPARLFGLTNSAQIAVELFEKFDGVKLVEETEEAVKN